MECLNKNGIIVSDCVVFDFFKKSVDMLVKKFGIKVIFLLSMEMGDEVSFCVYVFFDKLSNRPDNYTYRASTLEEISSYLVAL